MINTSKSSGGFPQATHPHVGFGPHVPGPPIHVGLMSDPPERFDCIVSIQRAILTRLADLGTHVLLGCLRDREPDADEAGITYGLGAVAEVATLENRLGRRLAEIFESGRVLESVSFCARTGGARRLFWLREAMPDPTSKSLPSYDPSCLPGAVRHGLMLQREQAEKRRSETLWLRQRWSI